MNEDDLAETKAAELKAEHNTYLTCRQAIFAHARACMTRNLLTTLSKQSFVNKHLQTQVQD